MARQINLGRVRGADGSLNGITNATIKSSDGSIEVTNSGNSIDLKAKNASSTQASLTALQKQVESIEEGLGTTDTTLSNLTKKVEGNTTSISSMQTTLNSVKTTADAAAKKTDLTALQAKVTTAEGKITTLEGSLGTTSNLTANASGTAYQRIKKNADDISSLNTKNNTNTTNISNLQKSVGEINSSIETIEDSLGEYDTQFSNIQSSLNGKAASNHTHALSGNTVTGTLPISKGGTGATSAANARTALGLGTAATMNGSGSISSGNSGLVTGGTVYNAMLKKSDTNHKHPKSDIIDIIDIEMKCIALFDSHAVPSAPDEGNSYTGFEVTNWPQIKLEDIQYAIQKLDQFNFQGTEYPTREGTPHWNKFAPGNYTQIQYLVDLTQVIWHEYDVLTFYAYEGYIRYICFGEYPRDNMNFDIGDTVEWEIDLTVLSAIRSIIASGDLSNQLAIAELAEVMDANNTANQLAIAEIAEMMLTGE